MRSECSARRLTHKYAPATVLDTAFNCPHCESIAEQIWHSALVKTLKPGETPMILTDAEAEERFSDKAEDPEKRVMVRFWVKNSVSGYPFIVEDGSLYKRYYDGKSSS